VVTVIQPPKKNREPGKDSDHGYQHLSAGTGGGDGERRAGGGGDDGNHFPLPEYDLKPFGYRVGMSLTLVGITLMFAALTITYVSLVGTVNWRPVALPPLLWFSTVLILMSSVTLEAARRAWQRGEIPKTYVRLLATTLLGIAFIASQLFCWRQLVKQKVYVGFDTHSAFFYLLTGLHALHIVGGIAALCYLLMRVRRASQNELQIPATKAGRDLKPLPRAAFDASVLYWHFVDGLWVYVFMLLLFWK
jgi:cytochrome c oxidase subunit 3